MRTIRNRWLLGGSVFLLLFGVALPVHGQDTAAVTGTSEATTAASASPQAVTTASGILDATLFTTYMVDPLDQHVSWIVCGSTASSSGCYGSGTLGPFGRASALLEGNPLVNSITRTVTRQIFVVDTASASGVVLYVYKKTDVVSSTFDTVTVTLFRTVALPLTGGINTLCSMAANNGFLFIGTDQSPQAVRVQKSNFAVTKVGGFSPPINVTAITADQYGYVTVTQGLFNSGQSGFSVFGPNGALQEDGGGADVMLNTITAVSTNTLPKSSVNPAQRLRVTPKAASQ